MAETLQFELVSPERLLLSESVAMVVVPGSEGDLGVLPRHAPLISALRYGVIAVYPRRSEIGERIFVAGGLVEVTPERCTVLAEQALPLSQIDRATVEQRLKNAREDLADAKDAATRLAAQREVALAEAQLSALAQTSPG